MLKDDAYTVYIHIKKRNMFRTLAAKFAVATKANSISYLLRAGKRSLIVYESKKQSNAPVRPFGRAIQVELAMKVKML